MSLPIWTKLSGSELASIQERTDVSIVLPLEETSGITVTLISGALPTGLRINDYRIKGVAVEVSKTTEFEFVLRATSNDGIADRTYKIVVEGADAPVWQTPEGELGLTRSFRNQYWVDTLNTKWGIYESKVVGGAEADPEYNNGAISNVTGDGSDFFKREVTTNGVRIMGAGTVGGQTAVPDAWLEKVARMFELFTDPNGAGINQTFQRNLIKTLSGDTGTYHAGLPTIQRVARGAGADYSTNFLTDAGITFWNLTNLFDTHVQNDMVWYLNSTGDGYGDGDIDAQEVIEHVFHTLHMHGLPADDIKLYQFLAADWQSGDLYAAMEEAYDAGKWDPSGYQSPADDWKTNSDAFEVAAKEYLFLLNFAMFEYTELWDGGSLAPEWTDDMRTQAGILANNPLGYAFHNTWIAPVISKPSLATIRSIFQDGNTPAQDNPALAGASGYIVDAQVGGSVAWVVQDVDVYETIPSRETGSSGDYAYVSSLQQFWYKVDTRWYRINTTQIQGILGNNETLVLSDSVPNPNIDDFWLNTNKSNDGLDLILKYWDEAALVWRPLDYVVSKTPPVSPFEDQIWVHIFDDTFDFKIKVYNDSENIWEIVNAAYGTTPPDRLNIAYFILDSSIVDFQLEAIDRDLTAGQSLRYFIADDDGELPPGLKLSEDGKISGIVDPLLSLDVNDTTGYDTGEYDTVPLDLVVLDDDGYDSYFYDTTFYGFSTPTRRPTKLNRKYTFTVTVEDDTSFSKREFGIFVVGDDFLRSDNTIMKAATGLFTADNTYLRKPIWLTSGNLGVKRAENYVTIFLDVYDPNSLLGEISYNQQPFNDDGTPSVLPPGLVLDGITGELAGTVPYQPAVNKEYKFTIEALRQEVDSNDVVEINAGVYEDTLTGNSQIKINKLPINRDDGVDDLLSLIEENIVIDNLSYTIRSVNGDNSEYDLLNLSRPLEPTYKAKRIKTAYNNAIGQDYIYILDDGDNRVAAWKNKTLNYSASEVYVLVDNDKQNIPGTTITRKWHTMIRYTIDAGDSAGSLDLDYSVANIADTGDYVADFETWLAGAGIDTTYLYKRVSATSTQLVFDIPRNSIVENTIMNQNLFHTDDSVYGNLEINRGQQFFKVFLDNTLQRTFNLSNILDEQSGPQITLGVFKDTLITKKIGVTNVDTISTIKTFTVNILGEVDSTVTWITDPNLGTIPANRTSYLQLVANTTLVGSNLRYDLVGGKLPNGLTLKRDGEIVGKPNQYTTGTTLGLTTIDNRNTTFDNSTTTIDRKYVFKVLVRDLFGYSNSIQEFTLNVTDTDDKVYSNVFIKPFLKPAQRTVFNDFINDYTIFTPENIYRPYDENFGLKKDLTTLVYAGIESKNLANFVASTALNHKRKRFVFGELKSAVAKKEGTNEVLYEVVYVEITDPQQPTKGNTAVSITSPSANDLKINQVKLEIKDDGSAVETGLDSFIITMREGDPVKIAATSGSVPVATRSGEVSITALGQLEIVLRTGLVVVVRSSSTTTSGSGNPFRFRPNTNVLSVDNAGVKASQTQNVKRFISNIGNMRKRIADIGANDRQFLPLWMRSSQTTTGQELDYITAMPICYCKPGTSQTIIENIQNAKFDFTQLDYDIDRYIVDRTENNENQQFILFSDYKLNV